MANLSYDLIQSLASKKVFQRGEDYFYSGNVSNLTFDGNKYTAKVSGTQDYRVTVWQENNQWLANCNCPYDWEDYCKHSVAVMLAILASQGKLKKEGFSKNISSSKTPIKKVKPIKEIIKKLNQRNLQKVVLDLLKIHPEIEDHLRILTTTRKDSLAKRSVTDYKKIIKLTIPSFVDYYHTQEALIGTQEAEKLALSFIQKKDYSEAIKIYQAVFEVLIKALQHTDDSDGFFGDEIRFSFEKWTNCVLKLKNFEERKPYFDYIFKKFDNDDWEGFSFAGELLEIVVDKTSNSQDYQYLLEKVERQEKDLPSKKDQEDYHFSFQKSFFVNLQLDLLDKLKKQKDFFNLAQQNLSDGQVLIKFLKKFIKLKKDKQALQTAEKYFHKILPGYKEEVAQILLLLYQKFKDQDKEKEILFWLFFNNQNFDYYHALKKLCQKDKDWSNWKEKILKTLKAKGHPHTLIEVYFREKMIDEILTLAKHSDGEHVLESIAQGLAKSHPKDSFWIYQKLVSNFLIGYVGRSYYQSTCRWLRQMKKLGFSQEFKEFVESLREKYYNRPAFLDEAKNLC